MKGLFTTIIAPLLFLFLYPGQPGFEPTLIVLYPHEIVMAGNIAKELDQYTQETEITDEIRKGFVKEGLPENWKIVREKELEFARKQDFASLLALTISRDITYREVQYHDNLLIFPVKESAGADKNIYKSLAEKYHVTWVVNIVKVELSYAGSSKQIKVTLQLYNALTGWVFLDSFYTADDSVTPETCEPGSWLCLAENVKTHIARDVTDKVERNRHRHHAK